MSSDASPSALAPEAPQPGRVDVHLHQESSVQLLLSKCTPSRVSRAPAGRLLVASWVVQIVLGALSGTLGGMLYLGDYSSVRGSGAAIWTGAVAVLAGAVAFTHEKRGGICWALLRILLVLASFSTAVAAITIWADDFPRNYYMYGDSFCERERRYWPTYSPLTDSPKEVERQQLCRTYMAMVKTFIITLQAMLLGVWLLLLLASLTPLGLFFWKRCWSREAKDQKKLLEERGI